MFINGVYNTNVSEKWFAKFNEDWSNAVDRLNRSNCSLGNIVIKPKNNGNGNNFKLLPDGTVVSTENGYKKGGIR